jgi:hypothetical protein
MGTLEDAEIAPGRNAQLSWIQRKFSNLRLEETQIFPGNNQEVIENLTLMVRHINRTFPFYLPSRYKKYSETIYRCACAKTSAYIFVMGEMNANPFIKTCAGL